MGMIKEKEMCEQYTTLNWLQRLYQDHHEQTKEVSYYEHIAFHTLCESLGVPSLDLKTQINFYKKMLVSCPIWLL